MCGLQKILSKHVTVFSFEPISMLFRVSITFVFLVSSAEQRKLQTCLTGYMTDVQSWVDENGILTSSVDQRVAIDLSSRMNPVPMLHDKFEVLRSAKSRPVTYFSMAKCRLTRVPPIFRNEEAIGRWLASSVEYITFYGNTFMDVSLPGEQYEMNINATDAQEMKVDVTYQASQSMSLWSSGFHQSFFPKLREVDLRACYIRILSGNLFRGMPNLEALYLGENEIHHIDENAFLGLTNLIHLDFSRNEAYDSRGNLKSLVSPVFSVFGDLKNLISLDLSFTKFAQRNAEMFRCLSPKLQRLSICSTGLTSLRNGVFNGTSLRVLDISGNNGILNTNIFIGIEDTLEIIYASDIGLNNIELFANLKRLEVLQLTSNELTLIPSAIIETWSNLRILDLNKNRLTAWFEPTFSLAPKLQFLSVKQNNLNVISEEMIEDFTNITYLALSANFIVCSCHTRDFLEMAARNEINHTRTTMPFNVTKRNFDFHSGYRDFNIIVGKRSPVQLKTQYTEELEVQGNFVLVDFKSAKYKCLSVTSSKSLRFDEVTGCKHSRDIDYDEVIAGNHLKLLALLVIPCLLLPLLIFFIFRRNFIYCCITMRNSAMLSLINPKETSDEVTIFNYDVFVSYCNEDRGWVLDHLLPHLESDCSISACLHERDFQVGLSILENIVSCMDRSRSIMLIISQRFLMSQWCQFEMHLAQHRLLETRREDLTLVLLEEIPRRLRPTTLHYLMLTKTYIVWPTADPERVLFWKRLRKSLISHKLKQTDNVSLA